MPLNQEQRQGIVSYLTTNCECWKGGESILNGMTDDRLEVLKASAEENSKAIMVANAAVKGFADDKFQFRLNPETASWEKRAIQPVGNAHPDPKMRGMMEEDYDDDEDDEEMKAMKEHNRKKMTGNKRNSSDDDDDSSSTPKTTEEWVRKAPTEVQNMFRYAQQIEQREKDKIISELLVNVAESERQAHRERLNRRSLDDLANDLALVPKAPPTDTEPTSKYASKPARRVTNRSTDDEDMLVSPVYDWQQVKQGGDGITTEAAVANKEDLTENMNEDELLAQLPPSLRAKVQQANIIENRERNKIINQLTANMNDEEKERRLRSRLEKKSLDELKDLLSLTPQTPPATQRPPNYFGGVGAAAATLNRLNDVNEDVLTLPTINWADDDNAGLRNGSGRKR